MNFPSALAVISNLRFWRDCLMNYLVEASHKTPCHSYDSLDAWEESETSAMASIVLLIQTGLVNNSDELPEQVRRILHKNSKSRVVIVADSNLPARVLRAMDAGACGYVTSDADLARFQNVLGLVAAGGIYVPAASLLAAYSDNCENGIEDDTLLDSRGLTRSQMAVVRHLRMGARNKVIAQKMNLSEATVKVHVSNILKKLKVRNRTQVALLAKDLFGEMPLK